MALAIPRLQMRSMDKRGEPMRIRGVGGMELCGSPCGAFPYGGAIFAAALGERVCEGCLALCDWLGSAAIANARR